MTSSTHRDAAHCMFSTRTRASVAIDEAFADLPNLTARIDAAQSTSPSRNYAAETERLVTRISEQMKALDAQRRRLMRQLDDLNISCDI